MIRLRKRAGIAVVGAAGAIGMATLIPTADTAGVAGFMWCVACGDFGLADLLANVALFIPLGWSLFAVGLEWRVTMLVVLVTTGTVEGVQFQLVPGRYAGVSDILANVLGGVIGWSLPTLLVRLSARASRAGSVAVLSAAAATALVSGSARLLEVSQPEALAWRDGNPALPDGGPFTGSVIRTSLNGSVVPSRTWYDLSPGEPIRVVMHLRSGDPAAWRAEILSVRTPRGPAWLWVNQQARDIAVHLASVADRLRLRGQTVWVRNAMPRDRGTDVTVELSATREHYTVRVVSEEGVTIRGVTVSLSDGWRLLSPFPFTSGDRWGFVVGALWMVLVFGPVGWLATLHSSGSALGIGAVILLVLALLSIGSEPQVLSPFGWGGTIVGYGLGAYAAVRTRTRLQ